MDDFGMGYALGQDSGNGSNSGNGMWGGDGSWIFAFLIIALIFGGNRGLFGNGMTGGSDGAGYQGALTRGDLCSEFSFNNLDSAVRGVQTGLCDGFYAMNTGMLNGFHGVDNAVCQLGYQTQQGFSTLGAQLASCCCETQRAIDGVNFNTSTAINTLGNNLTNQMTTARFENQQCCCDTQRQIERGFCDVGYAAATNTRDIIQNAHNDTDRVIAKLDAMEMSRKDETIASLRSQVEALNLAQSQANQNNYLVSQLRPTAVPAYLTCSPFESSYGWGYSNRQGGCGCC